MHSWRARQKTAVCGGTSEKRVCGVVRTLHDGEDSAAGEEGFKHVASQAQSFELRLEDSLPSRDVHLPVNVTTHSSHTPADSPSPAFPFILAAFGITFSEKSTCLTPWCMLDELIMSISSQT